MSRNFRILGINHIGIAPKDVKRGRDFFSDILNLNDLGLETVTSQKTDTFMFGFDSQSSRLELLAPNPIGDGPIHKYLEKKGSGIHHIALAVDNIQAALEYLKSQNVRLIDETPRDGAHGTKIIFIHPEACGGILVELVQE